MSEFRCCVIEGSCGPMFTPSYQAQLEQTSSDSTPDVAAHLNPCKLPTASRVAPTSPDSMPKTSPIHPPIRAHHIQPNRIHMQFPRRQPHPQPRHHIIPNPTLV